MTWPEKPEAAPNIAAGVDDVEQRLLTLLADHGDRPPQTSTAASPDQVDLASVLIRLSKAAPVLVQLVLSAQPVDTILWDQIADLSTALAARCRREAARHHLSHPHALIAEDAVVADVMGEYR